MMCTRPPTKLPDFGGKFWNWGTFWPLTTSPPTRVDHSFGMYDDSKNWSQIFMWAWKLGDSCIWYVISATKLLASYIMELVLKSICRQRCRIDCCLECPSSGRRAGWVAGSQYRDPNLLNQVLRWTNNVPNTHCTFLPMHFILTAFSQIHPQCCVLFWTSYKIINFICIVHFKRKYFIHQLVWQ